MKNDRIYPFLNNLFPKPGRFDPTLFEQLTELVIDLKKEVDNLDFKDYTINDVVYKEFSYEDKPIIVEASKKDMLGNIINEYYASISYVNDKTQTATEDEINYLFSIS